MIVQLTPTEAMTVKMIELNEAINGLGIPEGEAMTAVDGSKKGAEFAVAKALNLYPNLGGTLPVVPLVGRTHARVQVIWSKEPQASYNISRPRGDVFMVVTGTNPTFDICGFVMGKQLVKGSEGEYTVYHHVLTPMDEGFVFLQILNNTRDWTTAYSREGDQWKRKE